MAKYNNSVQGMIEGLSDFWLIYFKEVDQLAALYKGTEVLVGQVYLDMLSLLINNSIQDTTIFNKEYFRVITLKESDLRFKLGVTADDNRHVFTLPDNIVSVQGLHNKILSPTAVMDRDVDFYLDTEKRELAFKTDPTNAYYEIILGSSSESLFRIRSKIVPGDQIEITLVDDGTDPISVVQTGYSIAVRYAGPGFGSTHSAADIVRAINLAEVTSGLVLAEVTGLSGGKGSPAGVGPVSLARVDVNVRDGYAIRLVDTIHTAKFTAATPALAPPDWVVSGVEKGDTLRLLRGGVVGTSTDLLIELVRSDALYVSAADSSTLTAGDQVDFAVLRTPADSEVLAERIGNSGNIVDTGNNGVLVGVASTFSSATASFSLCNLGDIIEYSGVDNVGYAVIAEVLGPNDVTLAKLGLLDEVALHWNLHATIDPLNTNVDGVLVNNLDGTANFTAASATFTSAAPGTVLKIWDPGPPGIMSHYTILELVGPLEIVIEADATVPAGAGLVWGWARWVPAATTLAYSPPVAWPHSLVINARRLVDDAVVVEGQDYLFSEDSGIVQPITVWKTSLANQASYSFSLVLLENSSPFHLGVANGSLTTGPDTFTFGAGIFTDEYAGCLLRISGSGSGNNGDYYIASAPTATTLLLTTDKTVTAPEAGLTWQIYRRGEVVLDVTATQTEMSVWSPDVLVDRFHLYTTFGYLVGRYERSSETYRALIRGVFQLFMLGPTLERLEAAINLVTGFTTVRDNGEILLGYDNGALQSGTDGFFQGVTQGFSSATAAFTADHVGYYIFAVDGVNANLLFKIQTVVSGTEVILETTPQTIGPCGWELTYKAEHSVETSRTTYVFDRDIPIKDKFTDPANVGVSILKAFEVLTAVFEVTDYLETPTWWDSIQIPSELMPDQTDERRQCVPYLYEHKIDPVDGGLIGDPGFYLGADDEGLVPPVTLVRDDAGALDGEIIADAMYPHSNDVRFTSATAAFTAYDLGQVLVVDSGGPLEGTYTIIGVVSATEVQLAAWLPVTSGTGLAWEIYTQSVIKRHKMSFVVLNKFLKHNLFSVVFDTALWHRFASNFIADLHELVLVAKPTYTYVVVAPSSFLEEVLKVNEEFVEEVTISLFGPAGEIVVANENPLLVIGSSWKVGSWFRLIENATTFAAPAPVIPQPLGAPDPGYYHMVSKTFIDPTAYLEDPSGAPIQVAGEVLVPTHAGVGMDLVATGGEVLATYPTLPTPLSTYWLLTYLEITGSGLTNDGVFAIGGIHGANNEQISYFNPAGVTESGLNFRLLNAGSMLGRTYLTANGESRFVDTLGIHAFGFPVPVGHFIRRIVNYDATADNVFRINAGISAYEVEIADTARVEPVATDPDLNGAVAANIFTVALGVVVFSKSMCSEDREIANPATRDSVRYYIEFTGGPNAGSRVLLVRYLAPNSVELAPGTADDPALTFYITADWAYNVVDETTPWMHVVEQIEIADTEVVLINAPLAVADPAVAIDSWGVREPLDPAVAVFDETAGDTLYSVGMPDPHQRRGKSRTGKEPDLCEDPLEITRT